MISPFFDIQKEFQHSGMIDWLTLRIDLCHLPDAFVRHLQSMCSKLFKVNPHTGDIDWETYSWESVRSDTHQVCIRVGSDFWIQGSPARLGLPNNVFGSLDIKYCARKMISFAERYFNFSSIVGDHPDHTLTRSGEVCSGGLPPLERWTCSRIDVTRNYLMQSESEARQALAYLKQSPESKQKHSFEPNGFYIGKGSSLQSGKIYLKGQDAKRCKRSGRAEYTQVQIQKATKLLRAEQSLRRHFIRRLKEHRKINWYDLSPDMLLEFHDTYFKEYFSDIEVTDMSTHLENLIKVAPTEGQARAAYDCYTRIRMTGYEQAKETYTKRSWYRHIGNLKAAGFKRADLQMINVIPLKKRAIQLSEPVKHWDDIRIA